MTDLTNKWQTGDTAAFEVLFQQYEKLVFKSAYLITGSSEDAEDILQEVFVSVWKSRHTFNPEKAKLTTWLHKITVNKCLERRRKKKPALISLENLDLADKQDGQDEVLVKKQENEKLIKAMNSLDAKHRAALVLRYFDDLSYEEISQTLGVPLGTVKSRINQALKLLRGQYSLQQREWLGRGGRKS
jgi:RNA polymerase sigma-70 factor (ECF subfamily)